MCADREHHSTSAATTQVQRPPIPILCSYASKAPSTPPSIKPNYNILPASYHPTRPNPSARSCFLTFVGNHSPAPEFKSCHYDTSEIYMKKPCSPKIGRASCRERV